MWSCCEQLAVEGVVWSGGMVLGEERWTEGVEGGATWLGRVGVARAAVIGGDDSCP